MSLYKRIISLFTVLVMLFSSMSLAYGEDTSLKLDGETTVGDYKYSFNVDYDSQVAYGTNSNKPNIKVTAKVETLNSEITQTPIINNNSELQENTDYTITYNNSYCGNASFTIIGKGNYTGTITKTYTITGGSGNLSVSKITTNSASISYSGKGYKAYKVTCNNKEYKYSQSNNTINITGLTKGATYEVKLYGTDNENKEVLLNTKKFNAINSTTITTSSITSKSFKVKFSSVNGVNSYLLTVKNSKGKVIKNTSANANTYYTISGLSANTKYTITVIAKSNPNFTLGTKTITTLPTIGNVSIKVKAGEEMTNVSWKKTNGAKGYKIYRATSKNGKYKLVKTVSSKTTSYNNYLLSKGKTYYYKVRAYNGKRYGKYSAIKSAKAKSPTRNTYRLRTNIRTNVTCVYQRNLSGKYKAVKAFATSAGVRGASKAILGTHYTVNKYRWKYMHKDCYTQYATRITGHYLYHSVPYSAANPATLWTNSYNKLGNFASSGCIRMNVISVKWIYDHCPLKTRSDIVYSKTDPLKKPKVKRISSSVRGLKRVWDPTDPLKNNPWKK